MNSEQMKSRTRKFAFDVIRFVESFKPTKTADIIGKQLIRSGTSIVANYREACRARSRADFISKITIVESEADETLYWLELLRDANIGEDEAIGRLMKEADELTAIFTASGRTAKNNR